MHDDYVSTEHLLLAVAEDSDESMQEVCRQFGLNADKILSSIKANRKQSVSSDNPEDNYKSLEKYGRDLTAAARKGKLDPVIGRDEEIRRTMKYFRVVPRTIRFSSVNPVSVKQLLSKA